MSIRGLLFDKDGVIVDFERTWTPALKSLAVDIAGGDEHLAACYLERAGFDATRNTFVPGSVWAAGNTNDLARAWDDDPARQTALVRRVERHCSTLEPVSLLPLDELRQLFRGLARTGYRLGMATNDSEASAKTTLDRFFIADRFDLVMGYDSVPGPKPGADPVYRFCEHCALHPGEVAIVGDNIHDFEMGRSAGAGLIIAVLSGNSRRVDIPDYVHHILNDISQLPELLGRIQHV